MFLAFLLLMSGSAALIYEIGWSRQIGLLFGHSVHAAAIVLAVTFAGMGAGYAVGGRWAQRLKRPLRGYAVAEFAAAIWAGFSPLLIQAFQAPAIANWLYNENPTLKLLVRGLATAVILFPATFALGLTFPFVAESLSKQKRTSARSTAWAYSANTFGAVLGVVAGSFVLISAFGVRESLWIAATLSTVAGLGGLWLANRNPKSPPFLGSERHPDAIRESVSEISSGSIPKTSPETSPETNSETSPENGLQAHSPEVASSLRIDPIWIALAALSGAGTLGLQVLYTRLFSLIFQNSTYTFGLTIATFLLALAAGSYLFGWWRRPQLTSTSQSVHEVNQRPPEHHSSTVGPILALGAMAVPLSLLMFVAVSDMRLSILTIRDHHSDNGFLRYVMYAATQVGCVVIPPVTLLGMILPWCWSSTNDPTGRVVGRLGAINTLAAALGALFTSFVLLPLCGTWGGFTFWTIAYLLAAAVIAFRDRSLVTAIFCSAGFMLLPLVMKSMTHFDGPQRSDEILVKRWESPYGWVDVVKSERDGNLRIVQDLHYGFGSSNSVAMMTRMGHVPLLLHPAPKRVMFLGLATGLTSSSALAHPTVESIDVVELIPEVKEAARYFDEFNRGVVDDPKVTIHLDDARHCLIREPGPWDVIVSDLFVPWHSRAGYLYTVEHYQLASKRLSENGLFCQWLPLWQLGENEFCLIADSMSQAFPHVTVWRIDGTDSRPLLGLIGSASPIKVNRERLMSSMMEMDWGTRKPDSLITQLDRFEGLYLGDWVADPKRPLNTDNHPRLEFSAPLSHANSRLLTGQRFRDFAVSQLKVLKKESVKFD